MAHAFLMEWVLGAGRGHGTLLAFLAGGELPAGGELLARGEPLLAGRGHEPKARGALLLALSAERVWHAGRRCTAPCG